MKGEEKQQKARRKSKWSWCGKMEDKRQTRERSREQMKKILWGMKVKSRDGEGQGEDD